MSDEAESDRERFERLAPGRVSKVLAALRVLGNCATTASYEYEQLEVDHIFGELQRGLDDCEQKFRPKKAATTYKLPGPAGSGGPDFS